MEMKITAIFWEIGVVGLPGAELSNGNHILANDALRSLRLVRLKSASKIPLKKMRLNH